MYLHSQPLIHKMEVVRQPHPTRLFLAVAASAALVFFTTAQPAHAIGTTIGLGNAASYSVLGGQSVTNTGPTTLSGSVGVNPGTAISGFPPGITGGVIHNNDAHSLQAQSDLTTAYNNAAGQAADATVGAQLGGLTLLPGVYHAPSSAQITGPLTLNAQGDPNAVFIFQIGSSLTTASSSSVVLLNNAQSCHVFWQIGASATLGTNSTFVGTIMALTSISVTTGATVQGRALARNGSVTLDNNVFTNVTCATATTAPTSTATSTTGPTSTATSTGAPTGTATSTGAPTNGSSAGQRGAAGAATESGTVLGESLTLGLANTGGPSGPLLGLGIGAVVAGAGLVLVAQRRRTT